MSNIKRIGVLQTRLDVTPKYRIGQVVVFDGDRGRIDTIFADLQSAMDCFIVPPNWYEMQTKKPKTLKTGYWYGVVLTRGAVLVGEDDVVHA